MFLGSNAIRKHLKGMTQANLTAEQVFHMAVERHRQGDLRSAEEMYRQLSGALPKDPTPKYMLAQLLVEKGVADEALKEIEKIFVIQPAHEKAKFLKGRILQGSDREAAIRHFRELLEATSDDYLVKAARSALRDTLYSETSYFDVLSELHEKLQPKTYLEIGVFKGASLSLVGPGTKVIGIDPVPQIEKQYSEGMHVFPDTSDNFFNTKNPLDIFGEPQIDFAFIDGMHLFEYALRDFINVERYSAHHTIVAIHDTVPLDELTASRERKTEFWSGDVWKFVRALKEYRPDLRLVNLPVAPTGLLLVSDLNPSSTVLGDSYEQIVKRYAEMPLSMLDGAFFESLDITSSRVNEILSSLVANP